MKALRRFWQKIGVDPIQLRALLSVYLKLDFRSLGSKQAQLDRRKKGLFFLMIFTYLFPSFIFAAIGAAKFDLMGFCLLNLGVAMVMISLSIIMEFHEIVINPDDAEIMGSKPVSSRTYFYAKMANLFFYVLVFGAALNVFPAFAGLFFPETNWTFPFVYYLIAWIAELASACLMIIFYGVLIRITNFERLKDVLAYAQVAFTFFVFVGYQFMLRLTEHVTRRISLGGVWNYFIPPAWFGSAILALYAPINLPILSMIFFAVAFTVVSMLYSLRNLSLDYAQWITKVSEGTRVKGDSKVKSGREIRPKALFHLSSPEEFVGYHLVSKYFRRNRNNRTRVFPAFAMPLVMIFLFVLDGSFKDPLSGNMGGTTIMALMFFVWMAAFFHQLIPFCDDWKASWIFHVAPVENYSRLYWGAVKAIFLKYFIPYYIFVFIVLSFFMPVLHSAIVCSFNFFFFTAFYLFLVIFTRDLPLSKKFERGESNTRFMVLFVLLPVLLIGSGLEYLAFKFPMFLPAGYILMVIWAWISYTIANKRFHQTMMAKEFSF